MLLRPPRARALLVLAHGAGAGMRHPFMEDFAQALAGEKIATWRYEFPYMASGKKRIDAPALLEACVRENVVAAAAEARGLPLFAGGKSMGGRMTSRAQSAEALPGVRGLVFAGFPLHPAGRPGIERAAHLDAVDLPMLFLQGTRDALADLTLLRRVLRRLGERATLRLYEKADHGFRGATALELAKAAAEWICP